MNLSQDNSHIQIYSNYCFNTTSREQEKCIRITWYMDNFNANIFFEFRDAKIFFAIK